jgi:hypothetical protein
MANLTLAIDDELLRRARLRALEQGTSVNALLREYLESFAGDGRAREGARGFLAVTERAGAGSGPAGRSWTRDDAHAR